MAGAEPQGFRRVPALLEYTNPGQFVPAWLLLCVLQWLCANPLLAAAGCAGFGVNCFGKVPLKLQGMLGFCSSLYKAGRVIMRVRVQNAEREKLINSKTYLR